MEHQVTEIRKLTKSKVLVTVDDSDTIPLYTGELRKYAIRENGMISPDVYEGIRAGLYKRALTRCLHLLKERDYLQGEVQMKLRRSGYPDDIIEAVEDTLRRERFLDDSRYIGNYLQFHGNEKSRRAVMDFLKRKGADPKAVEEACSAFYEDSPDSQTELAQRLLQKKLRSGETLEDWQTLQKARGFLFRKGFSADTIEKAVHAVLLEENPDQL
ncbi:MAG: RecX family transcriptional regulator [Lachnospiraceae bacterium]|nr:RecX family transcriptional regulator [Lachnospiraceae bacterium]MCH4030398.1 RecX family transcriptional regulator [Lachnospiraceae bacterium]MCH4069610.1 RecX family transcriptional regulator [Lachnospiraceae bacterium]MCH4107454.1 RecX family transcriptional regulator [Lachnospiraceae bacterium]MCI1301695.1 RecX family transcriptional regulator [Lachnospiraceae bacterium]